MLRHSIVIKHNQYIKMTRLRFNAASIQQDLLFSHRRWQEPRSEPLLKCPDMWAQRAV